MADISVVVIGRNEEDRLQALIDSIEQVRRQSCSVRQTIFVDSASTDKSVEIARSAFDLVAELGESAYLCASAGRAVGTNLAKGDWILYLDADMTIAPEFIPVIEELCENAAPDIAGFIGEYINVFDNGENKTTVFHTGKNGYATGLGGASLMRRSSVLKAGNWDPSIFSKEELDLFSRMRSNKCKFVALSVPMISHYTEKLSFSDRLRGLLLPNGGAGKKYFGPGQLVASRLVRGLSGWDVIRYEPLPLLLGLPFPISFLVAFATSPLVGLLTLVTLLGLLTAVFGTSKVAIHGATLVRIPFGIRKYRKDFKPDIKKIWSRVPLASPNLPA